MTKSFLPCRFLLVSLLFVTLPGSRGDDGSGYKNVYGNALQRCSAEGMALTGYTRTGYCVERRDDAGSHHICIDLRSSTAGGNFCTVTGQSDWCSDENMPCTEDSTDSSCPIERWCVCQWAFASYLQNTGGCDQIQDIQCDAINLEAILAYRSASGSKYSNALNCLVDRCNLDLNANYILRACRKGRFSALPKIMMWTSLSALMIGVVFWIRKRRKSSQATESLLPDNTKETYTPRAELS